VPSVPVSPLLNNKLGDQAGKHTHRHTQTVACGVQGPGLLKCLWRQLLGCESALKKRLLIEQLEAANRLSYSAVDALLSRGLVRPLCAVLRCAGL
jgi:hypothetical protein